MAQAILLAIAIVLVFSALPMLLASPVLAAAAAVALLAPTGYSYASGGLLPPPVIQDRHGSPEEWIGALIEHEGGLPKTDAGLTHDSTQDQPPVFALGVAHPIYPIEEWEVERISLKCGRFMTEFFLGDLAGEMDYAIIADFRVQYADGDGATLRWRTWRYGLCWGPWVLIPGDGPAGELRILSRQTRQGVTHEAYRSAAQEALSVHGDADRLTYSLWWAGRYAAAIRQPAQHR